MSDQQAFRELGFAKLDTDRTRRTGDPEVVYAAGKTTEQTLALLAALRETQPDRAALATRVPSSTLAAVAARFPDAVIDPVARCAAVGPAPEPIGRIAILSAGTSDAAVAAEAAFVARTHGAGVELIADVGVAGIHRLLAHQERFASADAMIVVAGMDGALPSAAGGLVGVPVIAVPTSVGYGASFGGLSALLAMLNSCAPGVVVVNIDNGFGAAVHAVRIVRAIHEERA